MDDQCVIKCKDLAILTNGTTQGTHVLVDGVELSNVVSIFFETDAKIRGVVATVELTDVQQNESIHVFKFELAEGKL